MHLRSIYAEYNASREDLPRLSKHDNWSWYKGEDILDLVLLGPSRNPGEFRFYYGSDGINDIRINVIDEWKAGRLYWHGFPSLDESLDINFDDRGSMSRQVDIMSPSSVSIQTDAPLPVWNDARLMDQRSGSSS